MKKFYFLFILGILYSTFTMAQYRVKVNVFANKKSDKLEVSVFSGTYALLDANGNKLRELNIGSSVFVEKKYNNFSVEIKNDTTFFSDKISLKGSGFLNLLQIKYSNSTRLYDDNLIVSMKNNFLQLINDVELEHYIAGVVQTESGIAKNVEFFKVQAVAARTFALKNIKKHAGEDYQLCDQTCCQVYKGRCSNSDIMIATSKTAGEVITDSLGEIIMSVFHSNSGGQTCNSEDVWGRALPYLRSVKDTFSVAQRSYSWQKKILRKDWLAFLKNKYNYPIEDANSVKKVVNFNQYNRRVYLVDNIDLRSIREHFKLRSTFFSVSEDGDNVKLSGYGFGHGVGLSQEGAINMARLGYNYIEILKFYYLGVQIKNISELNIDL
jgi:stage II sporulation protein D